MVPDKCDLPEGTLDLILQVVAAGPVHVYGICAASPADLARRGPSAAGLGLSRSQPTRNRGLSTADWKMSDTGREAKFDRLTTTGRGQLKAEAAVGLILETAGGLR